jgi:putative hydrolase of the HAD superfamily
MMIPSESGGVGGIVFDAVGTLIDPTPTVAEAYAEAALRQGVVLPTGVVRDRFRRHFGDDEADELRGPMATDEGREYRRWKRIVENVLPELPDVDRAFGELWDHFGRPGSWRCFPDVGPALRALEGSGISIRIGSNFDGRLRGVLGGLPELSGLVDGLVVSSEVGYRKPHPAFYRAACGALGLPPGRVLWVGDDPENDVRGPRSAGLRAVLIDRGGRAPGDLPRFEGLAGLVEALGRADRPDTPRPGPSGGGLGSGGASGR